MLLEQVVSEFLLYLDAVKGFSKNTVKAYRVELSKLQEVLGTDCNIESITLEDLRFCIGKLSMQNCSPASINQFIASVRGLFAYCKKFQYIKSNVSLELKTVKLPKKIPLFMTENEVDTLCREPEEKALLWPKRDKAIFELLYSSGCRVSELASLKLKDFSQDYSSAIVTGKGSKDRRVFFEKDAVSALGEYLEERKERFLKGKDIDKNESVFVNQKGSTLSVKGISWILTRYSGPEGTNHHVSPHAFRHTFASAMLASGADVRVVQEMLGHSSISTTQRYTHITKEQLINIYNKAHPHGGNKNE
jgi:integrase/recombinase XerC